MGTCGPGATNLVTGIATAQLDSHPDGRDHRQRAQRPDRQGRVPGDRHHRHHAADDQAQLPGAERRRHPARRRRGVLPRPPRPPRARSTSTSPRTPSSRRRRAEHPSLDDVIAGLPGFRPDARGPPEAAQAGRQGDRAGQAPADPRRARRPHRRGLGRAQGVRREDPDPGRVDAARHRRHRRGAPARVRLHGHARLEARQPRDPVGGPADRHRHALRRPRHRQRAHVRPVRPDHPRGHRPGGDRQERRRRGPDRRRREERPRRPHPPRPRGGPGDARRLRSPSWPSGARSPRAARGTARAPGRTACCPRTSSSSGSAS